MSFSSWKLLLAGLKSPWIVFELYFTTTVRTLNVMYTEAALGWQWTVESCCTVNVDTDFRQESTCHIPGLSLSAHISTHWSQSTDQWSSWFISDRSACKQHCCCWACCNQERIRCRGSYAWFLIADGILYSHFLLLARYVPNVAKRII